MSTTLEREVGSRERTAGKPRVLLVGTFGGGGIHRYVEEQRRHLDDVDVSTYDMQSSPGGEGLAWFLTWLLAGILAALRFPFRAPPDLVHVHTSHRFSFYRASFYVLFAAHVWQRPVLLHIHGSSFDDFLETDDIGVRWLQSIVFAAADRIVVLSDYWREVLSTRVSEGKVQVLPNAVDPSEYEPGFGDDPPHVVFVSNLIDRKGVRELVEALDELTSEDLEFRATIAGKGPLSDVVEELAARTESIEYVGYVSESEKRELLDSGAVFVLPTYAEGLPIAMLEGMAGGNAVVSTAVGSIPEVIGEENGHLIEPGDVEALAGALRAVVTEVDKTERMARRNRELIEEKYSWAEATDQLEQAYAAERQRA
jgi:glycosyltransferase involved in cell wall biosynthesis